jgi:orotate phosphoribosyltransferase
MHDLLDEDLLAHFRRPGHFVYESGRHGDLWLALELLLVDPVRLRHAAAHLAARLADPAPEVVCGPLVGGALVGHFVALELGVPFVYAEPRPASTDDRRYAIPVSLRPLVRGRRVAVVDDAINAGAATLATIQEIGDAEGAVVAVGALIVREPEAVALLSERGLPVEYLVGLSWQTWPAEECPLCRAGVPIEAPG